MIDSKTCCTHWLGKNNMLWRSMLFSSILSATCSGEWLNDSRPCWYVYSYVYSCICSCSFMSHQITFIIWMWSHFAANCTSPVSASQTVLISPVSSIWKLSVSTAGFVCQCLWIKQDFVVSRSWIKRSTHWTSCWTVIGKPSLKYWPLGFGRRIVQVAETLASLSCMVSFRSFIQKRAQQRLYYIISSPLMSSANTSTHSNYRHFDSDVMVNVACLHIFPMLLLPCLGTWRLWGLKQVDCVASDRMWVQ